MVSRKRIVRRRASKPAEILGRLRAHLIDEDGLSRFDGRPIATDTQPENALSNVEEEIDLPAELVQRYREIAKAIRHLLLNSPPDLKTFAAWQHREIANAVASAIRAKLRGHQIIKHKDTVGAIERWIVNQRLMGEYDLLRLAKIGLERGIPVRRPKSNEKVRRERLRLLSAEIDRIREHRPGFSLRAIYNSLINSKQSSLLLPPGSTTPMSWPAFFKKVKIFNLVPRRGKNDAFEPPWANDEPPDPPLPFKEALRRFKTRLAATRLKDPVTKS